MNIPTKRNKESRITGKPALRSSGFPAFRPSVVLSLLLIGALYSIFIPHVACGALTVTNLSVYPNPVSPALHDHVNISFNLSEAPGAAVVSVEVGGTEVALDPGDSYAAGLNVVKWPLEPDGTYDVEVLIDGIPLADSQITVDSVPPDIDNVSITPNPFSPNGDGINDVVDIDFTATRTFGVDEGYVGAVAAVPADWDWEPDDPDNSGISAAANGQLVVTWITDAPSQDTITFTVNGFDGTTLSTAALLLNPGVPIITNAVYYTAVTTVSITGTGGSDPNNLPNSNDTFTVDWVDWDWDWEPGDPDNSGISTATTAELVVTWITTDLSQDTITLTVNGFDGATPRSEALSLDPGVSTITTTVYYTEVTTVSITGTGGSYPNNLPNSNDTFTIDWRSVPDTTNGNIGTIAAEQVLDGTIGTVADQALGEWDWAPGHPDNSTLSGITGARLMVVWWSADPAQDPVTFTVHGAYKREVQSSDLSLSPNVYAVTDEFYNYVGHIEISGGTPDPADLFQVYWFGGDASVNIYDDSGAFLETLPARPRFTGGLADFPFIAGIGTYFVRWPSTGGTLAYDDGSYTARIQVTDTAGNISRKSKAIVINNEPVKLELVSVVPSFAIEGSTDTIAKISAELEDGIFDQATINYYLSETARISAKIYDSDMNLVRRVKPDQDAPDEFVEEGMGNGQVRWDGTDENGDKVSPSGEGRYTCVITASDSLTAETAEITVPIVVDNLAPDAPLINGIDSPTNEEEIGFSGVAEPGSTVKIFIDDIQVGTADTDPETGEFELEYTFALDPFLLPGLRRISAIAIDYAGNPGPVSDTLEILIDRTAPSVTDDAPEEWQSISMMGTAGESPSATDVSVTLTARDETGGSGIVRINVEWYTTDGRSGSYTFNATPDVDGNYPLEFQDVVVFSDEGVYGIYHWAVDAADNTGTKLSGSSPIRIDKTSPENLSVDRIFGDSWSSPAPEFDNTASSPALVIAGSASDSLSGIDRIMVRMDNDTASIEGEWETAIGTSTWFYNFSPSVSATTDFTLKVKAVDGAGNETGEVSIPLTFSPASTDKAVATLLPKGQIRLSWPDTPGAVAYNIYRDTSPFLDINDIRLWMAGVTDTVWVDGVDLGHPTTDGTEYYYLIQAVDTVVSGIISPAATVEIYEAQAIADKTPPSIENIVSSISPFSPNGDRIEDATEIFFTLTETTSVTLNIYSYENETLTLINRLLPKELFRIDSGVSSIQDELDEGIISNALRQQFASNEDYGVMLSQDAIVSVLETGARWLINDVSSSYTIEEDGIELVISLKVYPAGDNFVEWDGKGDPADPDDPDLYVGEGRYVYRFEASDTMDVAGNALLESISGDIWVLLTEFKVEDISVTPTPFSPDADKVRDVAHISYNVTHNADYVAGNVFSVKDGQQKIIDSIFAECLDYYWTGRLWASFHVNDGIRAGLSSERYYITPVNAGDPTDPPFHMANPLSPPADAQTIEDYLANYQAANPNWVPVPFNLEWDGAGATEATTYIIRLEAVKINGAKTLPKTHEIIVELPTIVPNDKTPPIVDFTNPLEGSVSSPSGGLSYVSAHLSDGQGTGVDLAKCTISLTDPNGGPVAGQQSNDSKATITWWLYESLAEDGSADGIYTIVVTAIDYAKNRSGELRFQFDYDASINDNVKPYVDGLPMVVDKNDNDVEEISEDGSTVIELTDPATRVAIDRFRVRICDNGSGIDLDLSSIELIRVIGTEERLVDAKKATIPDTRSCGVLILHLTDPLSLEGEDDGVYKLKVIPSDNAGNKDVNEYVFIYKTVDDLQVPTIDYVRLTDADGVTLPSGDSTAESPGPTPFELGQISEQPWDIRVSVSDLQPSVGINYEPEDPYITVTGPDSILLNGTIWYTETDWTSVGAFTDIVFSIDESEKPISDGDYTVNIIVQDNAGNWSESAVATFEFITFVVDDTQPPFINDVFGVRSVDDIMVEEVDVVVAQSEDMVLERADKFVNIIAYPEDGIDPPRVTGPICTGKYPYVRDIESVWVTLVDKESGVDTQLSSIRLIEPGIRMLLSIPLDSVPGDPVGDLDDGIVPVELETGLGLSDNVILWLEEESRRWLINDFDLKKTYSVHRNFTHMPDGTLPESLDVYERHLVNGELVADGFINAYMSLDWPVSLSINGWYTLDVLAVDNVRKSLFDVDIEALPPTAGDLVAQLDHGIISDDFQDVFSLSLQDALDDPAVYLSDNAIVNVVERGCMWLITDLGEGKLGVYNAGGCRWRTIDGQKTYIIEREVLEDGSEIDSTVEVLMSNATTIQIPDVFFFDNVSPVIDSVRVLHNGVQITGDSSFNTIRASIEEKESGINYDATSIVLKDENGRIVPGSLLLDEENGIVTWLLENDATLGDNSYTVEVRTEDMAGNEAASASDLRSLIQSDVPPPTVYFLFPDAGQLLDDGEPDEIPVFSGVIDRITVQIIDNSSVGIDLEESTIKVNEPNNTPDWWDIKGFQTYDESEQTLTWNFEQLLATDGRADGEYEVRVKVRDKGGRSHKTVSGYFIYDTRPPEVYKAEIGSRPWIGANYKPISSILESKGTGMPLNRIMVKLDDQFSDIAIDPAQDTGHGVSKIKIEGKGIKDTVQSHDGIDTLVLDFPTLSSTGEDDGIYTVQITAVDELGNSSLGDVPLVSNALPYHYTFVYDTTPPGIVCAQAFDGDENVVAVHSIPGTAAPTSIFGTCIDNDLDPENKSLVLGKMDRVKVKLSDGDAGVGLDLGATASAIFVYGPHGQIEGSRYTEGDDTVAFKFSRRFSATDSSDDGTYTFKTTAFDTVGNRTPVEFSFEYKALAPLLVDIEVATDDGEVFSLSTDQNKQFLRSVTQVRAVLEDRSGKGLNFDASFIAVAGPGVSHLDSSEDNQEDILTYMFGEPLATDGSDDGEYTVFVRAIDNDGHWAEFLVAFLMDSTPPEVISTVPEDGAMLRERLTGVSAKLEDDLVGVDLFKSEISIRGPVAISSMQVNNGTDTISLKFFPLPDNGTADGRYSISINPVDLLENKFPEPLTYSFVYDTTPPELVSTEPSGGELVTVPVERVIAVLKDKPEGRPEDEASGINLGSSHLTIEGPDGLLLDGELSKSEPDTLIFRPMKSFAVDGTDDGTYTIRVITVDNLGNVSEPIVTRFTYAGTVSPTLSSTSPGDGESIGIPVSYVSATLVDKSGVGLDLERTQVSLLGPDGVPVPGLHDMESAAPLAVLSWNFSTTQDDLLSVVGEIKNISDSLKDSVKVTATFYDINGDVVNTASNVTIPVDIAPGGIASFRIESENTGKEKTAKIQVFYGSDQNLVDETAGTAIFRLGKILSTDGADDGTYTLEVLGFDKRGISATYRTTFVYDTSSPSVLESLPGDGDTLGGSFDQVLVRLADSGSGVDLENSVIDVLGIIGTQVNDGVDTIKYRFLPLSKDSSADGIYTVSIMPVDKVGNKPPSSLTFKFTHDTSAPVIIDASPADGSTVVAALDQVFVTLEDAGSGVSSEESELHLYAPDGSEITGVKSVQDAEVSTASQSGEVLQKTLTISLKFPPLTVDGEDDGEYSLTVVKKDDVGNEETEVINFTYLPTAPDLTALAPEDGSNLSVPVDRIEAKLADKSGAGIDFDSSEIKLSGPDGVEIKGQISHDGVDTLLFYLQNTFATDGTDDGQYTIEIKAVDSRGSTAVYEAKFSYDTTWPEVLLTIPEDGSLVNTPVSEVSAKLYDSMTQLNLFETSAALNSPIAISTAQINDGVDIVGLRFLELADDGTMDGLYEFLVTPMDILDNKPPEPLPFSFVYDTMPPKIVSAEPSDDELVTSRMERVLIVLSDGTTGEVAGVDLDACSFALIAPDGEEVEGELRKAEPDSLSFELSASTADGLADGTYTIRVSTQDLVGNVSVPILMSFTYITKSPAVSSTIPANGEQLNTPVSYVEAVLIDNSGTGLNAEKSNLTLLGPDGSSVPGQAGWRDPDTAVYTLNNALATDGADDGTYSLEILSVDNAGGSFNYSTSFVYDTTPPVVKTTSPANGDMIREDIGLVSVQIEDSGVGVDLELSEMMVAGVFGSKVNDGVNTIKYKFAPLSSTTSSDSDKDGLYIINVVPKDKLGNAPPESLTFSFIFDTKAPFVKDVKPADGSTVVVALDRVSVQMGDDGSGPDPQESRIQLYGSDGRQVVGVREDDADTMILTFPPLSIDGEDNGKYIVNVVTKDQIGNTSEEFNFGFTYLPTAPGLVTLSPEDGSILSQPIESIVASLGDKSGTGIDFGSSYVRLLGPDSQEIAGEMSNSGENLILTLQNLFATDGVDDGEYTMEIKAVDNAGNEVTYQRYFHYDTTPATISAVYVGDAQNSVEIAASDIEPYTPVPSDLGTLVKVSAVILDAGAGVDLSLSQISIIDSAGSNIIGTQKNDGVNTISLEFDPIEVEDDGIYTILVDPKDKLENEYPIAKTYIFMIDTQIPVVSASTPADGSMVVNTKLPEVIVYLDDGDGSGIDSGMSSVEVSGPNGEISGELLPQEDASILLYKFDKLLALDGSDDGDYVIKVLFADRVGNMAKGVSDNEPVSLFFTYDTVQPGGPVVNNVGVFPKAFSPNGDGTYDNTTISYVLSKDAQVRLLIYDDSRMLVDTLLDSEPRTAGTNALVWDGVVNGEVLPDGAYSLTIDAVDDRGLTGAVESSSVMIDTHPPSADRPVVSNNPFTPDGDGFADTTTISFMVSGSQTVEPGSEPQDSVSVTIYNRFSEKVASPPLNRTFDGDGKYSVTWDGSGTEEDGEYDFIIAAQDIAGNIREISGALALDKVGPSVEVLVPEPDDMPTNQSPVILSGTATDWSGVRSVSIIGDFFPSGSTTRIKDPINNWIRVTLSGDKVDNDGDGTVDEEEFDGVDNDRDGLVDEDLVGKDEISEPVHWIYHLDPQANGKYVLTIRATDSINHDSKQTLNIEYDAALPIHVSTTAVSSSFEDSEEMRTRNGDTIMLTTKWNEPGYKVTVDFSQLDSQITEALEAEDQGDGSYLVDYKMSDENTRSDGLKTIVISAEDNAKNRTVVGTFRMSLRNSLPTIVSVSSPDGRKAFTNGSLVKIEVVCDSSDLVVSADFADLDSTYMPDNVRVTNRGNNRYLVEYTIGINNELPDRPSIPVIISASDGVESVSSQYDVSLDNILPKVDRIMVRASTGTQTSSWSEAKQRMINVFSVEDLSVTNGNVVEIQTVWDAPGHTISADFSAMDSTYRAGAEQIEASESMYTILYELSKSSNASDGEKSISMKAVDEAGNVGQIELQVVLDNTAPSILAVTNGDEDSVYKNGDNVTLLVKLDGSEYEVSGDFSVLDSDYPSGVKPVKSPESNGDGTYTYSVKYVISKENTKAANSTLSGIHIAVSAIDSVGNTSTDSSMVVELDNFPPELEIESPASDVLVTTAWITIEGQTEPGAKITVKPEPSSSSLMDNGKYSYSVALDIGDNVIVITASDTAGNQTTKSLTVVYNPLIKAAEGGTVYLPERKNDGIEGNDTKVIVPPGAAEQDFSIEIKELELESVPDAVDNTDIGQGVISALVAYEFTLKDAAGEHPISMAFVKPIELYLQHQGLSKLNGPAVVFRWDGVRWNRIGGQEDRNSDTVKIVVNSLSIFGIFEGVEVPTEFKIAGAFPNPFTPNSDGVNDAISFYFDNPDNSEAVVRIFDLRGAMIRKLEDGLTSWDGLDDGGEPAEMGVYIYQIEVGDKVEGSTIVLAR